MRLPDIKLGEVVLVLYTDAASSDYKRTRRLVPDFDGVERAFWHLAYIGLSLIHGEIDVVGAQIDS